MSTPKVMTLSFLLRDDAICLAMKKRGFGEGNWNGYGGKLQDGETVLQGAVREIKEESGVDVDECDLEVVALTDFIFEDGKHLLVHTYFTRVWQGEPIETEEMRPRWYAYGAVPYDLMWADDIHWLPRVLKGEKLRGTVYFNSDGETIKDMEWKVIEEF